jgi:hypothetical protein
VTPLLKSKTNEGFLFSRTAVKETEIRRPSSYDLIYLKANNILCQIEIQKSVN